MDIEELTSALDAHAPAGADVLAKLRAKRDRQVRRRWLTAGGTAVAVTCALVALNLTTGKSATAPGADGNQAAAGCAVMPLSETLSSARAEGGSVITAHVALTGQYSDPSHTGFAQMRLSDVRTVSGPVIASGTEVWVVSVQHPSPSVGATGSNLWAPDGSIMAVALPQAATQNPRGLTLRMAPLVDGKVIFSSAGCWDSDGLPRTRFTGKLSEVPGSDTYTLTANSSGFWAVPLAAVEHLAKP